MSNTSARIRFNLSKLKIGTYTVYVYFKDPEKLSLVHELFILRSKNLNCQKR